MTIADQHPLSDEMLQALLDAYRGLYTVEYDEVLRQLKHKTIFGRDDVELVATWKFGTGPSASLAHGIFWAGTPIATSIT